MSHTQTAIDSKVDSLVLLFILGRPQQVLHGPDQETDQTVHAQLNADICRLYKLKDAFADSAKQYFHCLSNNYYVDQLDYENDGLIWPDWLQREPVVVKRDNKCSPPTIHTHPHPTKSAQLYHQHWLCQFISNKHNYHDRSSYPNSFQRYLRNRHESMTYVISLYHPSDTISQITTARPCVLQH
jgi:hypothetical protein